MFWRRVLGQGGEEMWELFPDSFLCCNQDWEGQIEGLTVQSVVLTGLRTGGATEKSQL